MLIFVVNFIVIQCGCLLLKSGNLLTYLLTRYNYKRCILWYLCSTYLFFSCVKSTLHWYIYYHSLLRHVRQHKNKNKNMAVSRQTYHAQVNDEPEQACWAGRVQCLQVTEGRCEGEDDSTATHWTCECLTAESLGILHSEMYILLMAYYDVSMFLPNIIWIGLHLAFGQWNMHRYCPWSWSRGTSRTLLCGLGLGLAQWFCLHVNALNFNSVTVSN